VRARVPGFLGASDGPSRLVLVDPKSSTDNLSRNSLLEWPIPKLHTATSALDPRSHLDPSYQRRKRGKHD